MLRLLVILCVACGGAPWPKRPVVAVSDRGAEPRQLLRYQPVAGSSERIEATLKLRTRTTYVNTVLEEGRRDLDFPAVRVRGPVTVSDVSPGRDAVLTLQIDETELLDDVVDPRMRAAFVARVDALRGKRHSWRRAANGALSVAASADSEWNGFADALRGSAILFPDVPVGIGATWQVTSAFEAGDVRWRRTATYHLRDRTDGSVTIDAEIDLRAEDQALSTEPNATRHLTSGRGHTSMHAVLPLSGVVGSSDAKDTGELNLLVTQRHLRVTSTVTTESVFSIAPVAARLP